ncbi:hypothetical protein Tpen_1438 [Thermofilum pendens Hrk 5]|uniref:MFS transporter n=1 Tax=Thermofilum pendens (strain DSM 2475 / Hrk 5) TaxID=368408 RepID=A1S055_THEPD|nr:hypothetical protein Tpen_1438 [Thermofilum pendens Hrk 5]
MVRVSMPAGSRVHPGRRSPSGIRGFRRPPPSLRRANNPPGLRRGQEGGRPRPAVHSLVHPRLHSRRTLGAKPPSAAPDPPSPPSARPGSGPRVVRRFEVRPAPILDPEAPERVNAVLEVSYSIAMVAGPPLAAWMASAGPAGISAAVALELSALALLTAVLARRGLNAPIGPGGGFLQALCRLAGSRAPRLALVLSTAISGVGALVNVSVALVAGRLGEVLPGFTASYSLLSALTGLGSLAASALAARRGVLGEGFLYAGLLLLSAYPALLGLSMSAEPSLLLATILLAFSTLNGFGNGAFFLWILSAVQRSMGGDVGKALATLYVLGALAGLPFSLAAGIAAQSLPALLVASSVLLASLPATAALATRFSPGRA